MHLTADILLRGYASGIFPMAESRDSDRIHWLEPAVRGVLPVDGMHIPRSLRKVLHRDDLEVRCSTAFADVVDACATPHKGRENTWINPAIQRAYCQLYEAGFAQSVEVWKNERLVGGLYGVCIGAAFFGESMFNRLDNASKVALVHLVARLRKGGYRLLDTQFLTAHLAHFGVVEIRRNSYQRHLNSALQQLAKFPKELTRQELEDFIVHCHDNPPAPAP